MATIVCNTRVLNKHLTGVQRYLNEILRHNDGSLDIVSPTKYINGIGGHAWEQGVLPWKLSGRLLWSPSNSGPIGVRRQVVTIHDMVPFDASDTLNQKFVTWYKFFQPALLRRVSRIITVSEFTRGRMLDRFPYLEGKTEVVHNGVDDRFKPQSEASISAAVAALRIPSPRYVLSVGSLEPRKNLKRLIAAWSLVQHQLPDDIWLVLAGGRGVQRVYASAEEGNLPPRVHMTGHVPDELLPSLMSGAMAFLYPSYYEGFGLPPLEAMACGTAVLTANNSCMPEIVADSALQVDPYNKEAISEGIYMLIENSELRADLVSRGFNRVRGFAWKDTAARTLGILQNASLEA